MAATVLKYPGSKATMAPALVASFPPHVAYLEPFFGGGSVFFTKAPSRLETLNDLDGMVVNLFRVMRDRPGDLARAVALTPYAREEYLVSYEPPTGDELEDARRFLVRTWQTRSAQTGGRAGWRWVIDPIARNAASHEWSDLPDRILASAGRLKLAQIERRPALEIIALHAHPDTLIYADPPYPLATRYKKLYKHEMTDADHAALLDALDAHPGPVVLSGYACPLYDDRLGHWQREEIAATAEGGRARTEIVWRNTKAARARLC